MIEDKEKLRVLHAENISLKREKIMKKLFIGLLALGSVSAFAETFELCLNQKLIYSMESKNVIPVIDANNTKDERTSFLGCANGTYGSYLHLLDTPFIGQHMLNMTDAECFKILNSMKADPTLVYEFEFYEDEVLSVAKSATKTCYR